MNNLYFLLTALPELEYPKKPFISREELNSLIEANISSKEREVFQLYRSWKDVENIRRMLLNEPFLEGGLYNRIELEDALRERVGLPQAVFDYLDRFTTKDEQLRNFPQLLRTLFHQEANGSTFFNKLMAFEERMRLTLAYIRAQHKVADGTITALESDEEDPFIQDLLSIQKGSLEISEPYSDLPAIYEAKRYSPFELELALSEWRYKQYAALANDALFSFDQVLLYAVQYDLLEQIAHLESREGLINVHQLFEAS